MIVHGVLFLMISLYLLGTAILMAVMFANLEPPPQRQNGPSPEVMAAAFGIGLGSIGLLAGVAGALQVYYGWRVFNFRSRTGGLVSLFIGAAGMITLYCAPTAIGLFIYGLIVLLNVAVREAFALGRNGYTGDQIDAIFNPWFQQQPPDFNSPQPPRK
jgi:hypothetical protein